MYKSLKGKVCVVTGSAKSIGLAIAERYCTDGAVVAMIDIDRQVEEEAECLTSKGYSAEAYVIDITNRNAVLSCFKQIEETLGPVYTLVNNAGIVDQRPFEEITPEHIDKIMRVNVYGSLFCSQGAVRSMKENKEGRIINFSSKSGKTGSALMAHYSAAKGAIISMTHALAFRSEEH